MSCKISVFRAAREMNSCRNFKEGHDNVLKEYQVYNDIPVNDDWIGAENVYCIVAESLADNKLIGGLRIQVADGKTVLPIETAVGKMNKLISKAITHCHEHGGIAEMGALWHLKSVAGTGITSLLIRAGVSLSRQLGAGTFITLCTDYTLDKFYQTGFRELIALAGQSNYPYPNEFYSAKILGIVDPEILSNAEAADRSRIESLRGAPLQNFIEFEDDQGLKITYNLTIN